MFLCILPAGAASGILSGILAIAGRTLLAGTTDRPYHGRGISGAQFRGHQGGYRNIPCLHRAAVPIHHLLPDEKGPHALRDCKADAAADRDRAGARGRASATGALERV